MLTPINHEISNFLLHHINEIPLFSVRETPSHYLVAVDLPNLSTDEMYIREKNKNIYVEGINKNEPTRKQTYFYFHPESKNCQTIYQDGILWLAMPKYANKKSATHFLGEAS